MVATAPQEVSVEQFREGLYRLAGENQSQADQLFEEFKEAVLEDITLTLKAKKKGKSKEEVLFAQWKRREARKHYRRLRRNLGKRPLNTAGHHLVSWYDRRASAAREILRSFGIDIDSEENGINLPRYKKDTPHPDMPDAYAHSNIHTDDYYINVTGLLRAEAKDVNASKEDIEDVLSEIADGLKKGTFPIYEKIKLS